MNNREKFKTWLEDNFPKKSGAKSSYIGAIDLLSETINESIFDMIDIRKVKLLYEDVLIHQVDEKGKYYNKSAPSYGYKMFYSAALKAFIKFLENKEKEVKIKRNQATAKVNTIFSCSLFKENILQSGLFFEDKFLIRYTSALLTKPFVILTGLSRSEERRVGKECCR